MIRRGAALVFFFLRTSFLRPSVNPVLPVATAFLVLFHAEGSLDRYHVALLFYLTAVAHAFTGDLFGDPREARAREAASPLERIFLPLPVSGGRIFLAYLGAALVYAVLVFLLFSFLLHQETRLPGFVGGEMVKFPTGGGDTTLVYRGFAVTPRGIQYPASVVIERSFFFDALARLGPGRAPLAAYYVLVFVYVVALQAARQFRVGRFAGAFHALPLALYMVAGLALFAELLLTPREAGSLVRAFVAHAGEAAAAVTAALALTLAATLSIARTVYVRLEGGRS